MKKLKYLLLLVLVAASFNCYSQNEISIAASGYSKWNSKTGALSDQKYSGIELKVKYVPSVPTLNFYLYTDNGKNLEGLFGARGGHGSYYYNYDNSRKDTYAVFWEIILSSTDNNNFVRLLIPYKYDKEGFIYFGDFKSDVQKFALIPARDTERVYRLVVNAVQKLGLTKAAKSLPMQFF